MVQELTKVSPVHTAGDWILFSTECGEGAPGEQRHRISVDGRSEIAYLQSYTSPDGDKWGIGRDETEANARLIAAAPDLLAACNTAMILRNLGGMLPAVREILDIVVEAADAAIAKAKGGA